MDDIGNQIYVQTLGGFSLKIGEKTICNKKNHTSKVWRLLALLAYNYNRTVSRAEIIEALWGDDDRDIDYVNSLKTLSHRLREILDEFGKNFGKICVVPSGNGYAFSDKVNVTLDCEEFEKLCKNAERENGNEEKLDILKKAIDTYNGEFMPAINTDAWVFPLSSYYHNMFINAVNKAVEILNEQGRYTEISVICYKAVDIEPNDEELYYNLISALFNSDNQQAALQVYNGMSELMFSRFGILPSDELRELYSEITTSIGTREEDLLIIKEKLAEHEPPKGAYLCNFEYFQMFYRVMARTMLRYGSAIHVALMTISGRDGVELSKRSMDCCAKNLEKIIIESLRSGDMVARSSVSQYLIILPQANYENSCMVMNRIIKNFKRAYPCSPGTVRFTVQPIEPSVR